MRAQLLKALGIGSFALAGACASSPALNVHRDCAASQTPVQLDTAGSLEGLAGEYSDGIRSLSLLQAGYEVLAIDGTREVRLRKTAEWRFEDGCGTAYQLSLPLDGVGATLDIIDREGQHTRLQRVGRALS